MTGRAAILPRAVPDSSSCKPEWMQTAAPPLTAKKTMMEEEEEAAAEVGVEVEVEVEVEAEVEVEVEVEVEAEAEAVVLDHPSHHRILIQHRSSSRS